jgi:alkanesulfonate monooxygenase SsuD/methylene tetrahydromethanopterin reductase-like flavin-dependent oxidoreductase (luciferase family)
MVEATPATHRHLRIHAGHCTYLLPEEAKFVTPNLIKSTCLVGTPEEIIEQIRHLEQAGLRQIMLLPSLETQYRVIEDFARQVMEKM